jgi:hypothetical protein
MAAIDDAVADQARHTARCIMSRYPVHYDVLERPSAYSKSGLIARLIAFCALAVLGVSFGLAFLFLYLALPVFASVRVANRGAPAYFDDDGPRVIRILRWLAALQAWAGLTTDRLPAGSPAEIVRLDVEGPAHPTPGSALWRVLTGIPSALVLGLLSWIGCFVWLWSALSILFVGRVGPGAYAYLVGIQRWSMRLLTFQASLVDEYPPFGFADPSTTLPTARATSI